MLPKFQLMSRNQCSHKHFNFKLNLQCQHKTFKDGLSHIHCILFFEKNLPLVSAVTQLPFCPKCPSSSFKFLASLPVILSLWLHPPNTPTNIMIQVCKDSGASCQCRLQVQVPSHHFFMTQVRMARSRVRACTRTNVD